MIFFMSCSQFADKPAKREVKVAIRRRVYIVSGCVLLRRRMRR